MNYFSAESLSKSFGEQHLFENLTFGLEKGEKTALIARNGSGKTTLLRILMGKVTADSGVFTFRGGVKTGFLEQAPVLDGSLTIDQLIFTGTNPILSVIHRYELALKNHSESQTPAAVKALELAIHKMDINDAWDYERRLKQLLDLFRITNTAQRVSELSGGEQKRLALAIVLLDKPDLLILDEPTNHLDIEMIEWLEQYLSQASLTLLMVTHDRYFLDRVCNRIIELDGGKLFHYQGNYELFLEKRADRSALSKIEADKANQLMKKELEWVRTMPKARTTKSKARLDAFDSIKERATRVIDESALKLQVKSPRLGGKILELDNISMGYNTLEIVKNFSYKFSKGERLGIIGRNGTGKTTFLNLLSEMEIPVSGTIIRGKTVVMGYYRQLGQQWDSSMRVIDAVKEIAEVVIMGDGKSISASQFLEHFLFTPEAQYKPISKLSGGELRRLHLLTVLIKNPNFLILDEPTNDLDLLALVKLEEFLLSFNGCLIIVSHDRYFLDKLTNHLFIFEGSGVINDHYGTYSNYRQKREITDRSQNDNPEKKSENPAGKEPEKVEKRVKTKLTYKEQQEYNLLESEIDNLESEKDNLERELSTGNLPYETLESKSKRVAELIALIDLKLRRWVELGEYTG
jgi:ATP-binding cassette subfamily F protein uup